MPKFIRAANYPLDFDAVGLWGLNTSTTFRDADYVSGSTSAPASSVNNNNPIGGGPTLFFDPVDDFWAAWKISRASNAFSQGPRGFSIYDAAGSLVAIIFKSATAVLTLTVYGDGTDSTTVSVVTPQATLLSFALRLEELGATRRLTFYAEGAEVGQVSVAVGTRGPGVAIVFGEIFGTQSTSTIAISEVLLTDGIDPRGLRVSARQPASAGSVNTFASGAFGDLAGSNPVTFAYTDTAGQRLLTTPAAYAGPATPNSVQAVMVNTRASRQTGTPDQLANTIRVGGTNFDDDPVTVDTITNVVSVWDENPDTEAPWSTSDLAGLEVGVVSGTS